MKTGILLDGSTPSGAPPLRWPLRVGFAACLGLATALGPVIAADLVAEIPFLPGEKWWGGQVVYSPDMPYDAAAQLHAKFGPVILALARQSAKTGDPMVRPLEWAWPHQGFATIKDQFMLGDEVMVAPVLTKDGRARTVVFLPGRWKDDDGPTVEGPTQREIHVPLGRLPYYQLQKRDPSRSMQSPKAKS